MVSPGKKPQPNSYGGTSRNYDQSTGFRKGTGYTKAIGSSYRQTPTGYSKQGLPAALAITTKSPYLAQNTGRQSYNMNSYESYNSGKGKKIINALISWITYQITSK